MIAAVVATIVGVALIIVGVVAVSSPQPPYARPVEAVPVSPDATNYEVATLADPEWVAATAAATGIPERVLAAYAGATIAMEGEHPYCNLGWTTLAGVGWTESHHGTANGSTVGADGVATPPIVGPELVGEGFSPQADSDGGTLDGDPASDRAVGPMQFLPSTWASYRSDGNQDGVFDPQHIDDAVIAAARYLCQAGDGDQHQREVWRDAVGSYNASDAYIADVAARANEYADLAG